MTDSNEHVQKTLAMVVDQVRALERQLADKRRTANDLSRLLNQPPMFNEEADASASLATVADEYYGKPMPDVVRTILEKRKRANQGAATVGDILDGMQAGGYHFQTQNDQYAKRGIYGMLSGSTEFHKLPNGRYGLALWYPAARTKDEIDTKQKRSKKSGRKATPKRKAAAKKRPVAPAAEPKALPAAETNGVVEAPQGGRMKAIKAAVQSMPATFSTVDLMTKLAKSGVTVTRDSLRPAVHRLKQDGLLDVIEIGVGKAPTTYKRKTTGNLG